jgi:hypothetical protein
MKTHSFLDHGLPERASRCVSILAVKRVERIREVQIGIAGHSQVRKLLSLPKRDVLRQFSIEVSLLDFLVQFPIALWAFQKVIEDGS